MAKYKDISGQKFGKLTAIKPIDEKCKSGHHKKWLCVCDCGNTAIVTSDHLIKEDTKTCGCYNHGKSNTRLFGIWTHMKSRCHVPTDDQYHNYGLRGIKVCDEWYKDFMAFYTWSMANGYSDKLSIDRIDNNKGYSPENCRWTTMKVQANNTSRNNRVSYNGQTLTIAEWSEITGIKQNTLTYRLRRGWSVERALTEKVNK